MPSKAPTHKPFRARAPVHAAPEAETRWGRGRGGRPWRRKRERILRRDGYLCQCEECRAHGRMLLATEVDHIVPESMGGSDDDSNLRAMHAGCHLRKTQREAGRARRGGG